jgi:hypothetical protein
MKFFGILHVHSKYSYDGEVSLAELRVLCERIGIQFVCLTEHVEGLSEERMREFVSECHERSDATFLFIPGFEVSYNNAHILKLDDNTEIIAHPHRSGFVFDEHVQSKCIGGEVWNSQYDGKRFPRWTSLQWFHDIAKNRNEFLALAGVDLHRPAHLSGPRIEIEADSLTKEVVLSAIHKGQYKLVTDSCSIDARGRILRPYPIAVLLGSMLDISIIWIIRRASTIAKRLGLHRFRIFQRVREYIRKKI